MFHRIGVALDGSSLAEAILPQGERLATQTALEVVLLAVVPPPHRLEERSGQFVPVNQLVAEEQADLARYLAEQAHRLRTQRVQAQTRVRCGDPAAEIVRCAEE